MTYVFKQLHFQQHGNNMAILIKIILRILKEIDTEQGK